MLIEPTESESLDEIDRQVDDQLFIGFVPHPRLDSRFCDAMIQIRREVQQIIDGKQPKENNILKNAPHPMSVMVLPDDQWKRSVARIEIRIMLSLCLCRPYSRQEAAYPLPWLYERKFWPTVTRIDDGTFHALVTMTRDR